MDRENLSAPGWSHVLSTTNDVAELDRFREQVGAPPQALQLGNAAIRTWISSSSRASWRWRTREVRVFERTRTCFVSGLGTPRIGRWGRRGRRQRTTDDGS